MLTPVEKADIIKSIGFMKSELFSILFRKNLTITNDKKIFEYYIKENTDFKKFKKGIYKNHKFEVVSLNDSKIKYCLRVLNPVDDSTKAYGVMVNTYKMVGLLIIEDYDAKLKYTFADRLELKNKKRVPTTESLEANPRQELENKRAEHNRELLVYPTRLNPIENRYGVSDTMNNLRRGLTKLSMKRVNALLGKQYTNHLDSNCAKSYTQAMMYYDKTERITTEEGEDITILNIDEVVYILLYNTSKEDMILIPVYNVTNHIVTRELAILLGLVKSDGKMSIKKFKIDENHMVDVSDLSKMVESMKL
jgi:hypothetical protein